MIPGTLRDSLFILAGLLEQQTSLDPREIMADTHGYSEVVFGLFALLGYRFSPRLADLADQRFWRIAKEDGYGPLNGLSRHVVDARLISDHWEDTLWLAGSLKLGKVKATAVMRTLQRSGSLSGLGRAVVELGRVEKTLYLLAYVHDEAYRRRILVQLNRGEGRQALACAVFHGRASYASATARAWKTSWGRLGWSSTCWCFGAPATCSRPWSSGRRWKGH